MLLACLARAGAMGNAGIVKWTRAASNPDVPGDFVASLLNGTAQGPEPTREHGACAWYDKLVVNGAAFPDNIQTHFVNATRRPAGNLSVAAFERQLRARFGDVLNSSAPVDEYARVDDFLELNLALFSPDLDGLAARLRARGAPFAALRWADEAGADCFSLLAPVAGAEGVVFEFVGLALAAGVPAARAPTPRVLALRATFGGANASCRAAGRACELVGAKVSFPAADANASARALRAALGGAGEVAVLDADGERRAVWTSSADLDALLGQVHFVERRPARAVPGAIGVAEWEATLAATHAAFVASPTSGFDQWLDFHVGMIQADATAAYEAGFVAQGVRYRCFASGGEPGPPGQFGAYWATPQGAGVQFLNGDCAEASAWDDCSPTGGGDGELREGKRP